VDKPKNKTWYQFAFEEARQGLPSDPPYERGNRHYNEYLAGYEDGEAQRD